MCLRRISTKRALVMFNMIFKLKKITLIILDNLLLKGKQTNFMFKNRFKQVT
jgi:hypothetical protein